MIFEFRDSLFGMLLMLMIVPPVVMVIPLFKIMIAMGILNTYASVILIYTGLTLPFSDLPAGQLLPHRAGGDRRFGPHRRLPGPSGAARASWCPVAAPAIITIVLVNALWVWNELLIAVIFLQRDELKTLMVGLTIFKSRYNLDIPVTMAGLALATIPMLALYFAGQKYFIRGMVAGAVK